MFNVFLLLVSLLTGMLNMCYNKYVSLNLLLPQFRDRKSSERSKAMLDNCVCDETTLRVSSKATGQCMYGAYRRHDRHTVTIYGMGWGGANGDQMKEASFPLLDVQVEI